jgi:hypothetical protein
VRAGIHERPPRVPRPPWSRSQGHRDKDEAPRESAVGDVRAIVIAGLDVVDAQGDRLAQHSERRVAILRRAVITKSWVSFYEFAVFSVTALACSDALFLDGGEAPGLYAPELGRNDRIIGDDVPRSAA